MKTTSTHSLCFFQQFSEHKSTSLHVLISSNLSTRKQEETREREMMNVLRTLQKPLPPHNNALTGDLLEDEEHASDLTSTYGPICILFIYIQGSLSTVHSWGNQWLKSSYIIFEIEKHSEIGELLEIWGSIIDGFTVPLLLKWLRLPQPIQYRNQMRI